jgi:plasmid stabilization system protein ParE
MKIRIRAAARADLQRQFHYLQQSHAGDETLDKLVSEVEEAVDKISRNPQTWSFAPGSQRVRRVQLPRFRMQVFYFIRSDGVPVVLEFAGPGLQPRWPGRL